MASDAHNHMAALKEHLECGRNAYKAGNLKTAVQSFTKAIRCCRCRGTGTPCECRDLQQALQNNVSLYDEATRPCKGKGAGAGAGKEGGACVRCPTACDDQYHFQALKYRAVLLEKMNRQDLAEQDILALIELAPTRLEVRKRSVHSRYVTHSASIQGYLHLGKMLRHKDQHELAFSVWDRAAKQASDSPDPETRNSPLREVSRFLSPPTA